MRLATKPDLQSAPPPSAQPQQISVKEPGPRERGQSALESDNGSKAQWLALAFEATRDAVRDWEVLSGELSWPQGLGPLLGYELSDVSRKIGFWQKHVHPEDRARIALSIQQALEGDQLWSGEYRFRHAEGHYLLVLERAIILRDGNGKAARFVGSLMDITARKQLQDQLIRSQKMDAFGRLAGGVAHDFNNFLTTILGYSDLLLGELKGSPAKQIGEIRSAAKRAAALTAQLLAFSRRQPLENRLVEVNGLISNMERSLLRLLGDNISVECHLQKSNEPAHIKADPNQLTQIILNLAVNARDAMPTGGRLTIGTGTLRLERDSQVPGCPEMLSAGEYALINLTDNGAGMTDEVKAHLFEPFFTTKEDGRGSGLGLATTYGIVRQSGGYICIDSHVGKGTMVTLYFPKVAPPPAPAYKKPGLAKSCVGTETILVLEDDVSVRHISVRVLRSLGYDVIEAANGDDAQRLIMLDHKKKIHLLLTDMVMPQMSGQDFAVWLRQTHPQTKVVFISGYLQESPLPDRQDGDVFFLPKPFDPEQLGMKIREALDARKAK